MSSIVALVLETSALDFVQKLSRQIPIWIADTPHHARLKSRQDINSGCFQITWFSLRESETLDQGAFRIVSSLDQHYNENVQEEGYDTLWFVGLHPRDTHLELLSAWGFKRIEPAWDGFIAVK